MSGKGPAQTGETCLAMNSAIQVFGTAGLIETVVQFAYVLTNMENFTAFEQLFFLTSGCFEMAGEAIFLVASLWFFMRDSKAWKRGGGLSFLARDPIHCMAASSFEAASGEVNEAREDYARWSFFGVLLSVLPFTAWASFWAVWGSPFDGDGDDNFRWALSICALIFTIVLLPCWVWTRDYCRLSVVMVMYATEKAFQVYILATDLERLSPSGLGASLVILQVIEILSVATLLGIILVKGAGGHGVSRRAVGPRISY